MANGFKAYRHARGGVQRLMEYPIAPTNAVPIYNGDAVILNGGELEVAADNTASQEVGVFLGCMYVNASGEQKFSPYWDGAAGSTEIKAIVSSDPGVTYRVELDTAPVVTDIGSKCAAQDNGGEVASVGISTQSAAKLADGSFTIRSIIDAANNLVEVSVNLGIEG
jgi:hypothetical protein